VMSTRTRPRLVLLLLPAPLTWMQAQPVQTGAGPASGAAGYLGDSRRRRAWNQAGALKPRGKRDASKRKKHRNGTRGAHTHERDCGVAGGSRLLP
jgi:hypothetical protein